MEVRDPVHGSIKVFDEEIPIIKHKFFQRLRNIKQLGFSEYSFPGATHTRYLHSIGVMHVSTLATQTLFKNVANQKEVERLKSTLRLSCLLHDIGHAPLSHSTEWVMPPLETLNLPKKYTINENLKRRSTHEDYTIKSLVDSSFSESFKEVCQKYGVTKEAIADLISGRPTDKSFFQIGSTNYFPVLHQLVSSELDCDRMDYLLRDSYFCGVSYGKYDLNWILDNLEICTEDNNAYLGISERAVSTFDDFLLSRFHMFLMIYFHYRAVCLEQMLFRYFSTSDGEYTIPADIEAYQEHDDQYLMKVLKNSKNEWARLIVANQTPEKIFEIFGPNQLSKLERLESFLQSENINYIRCSSQGRLSKYYDHESVDQNQFPLKVARQELPLVKKEFPQIYTDINEATDLFHKFSEAHAVNRIHCQIEILSATQQTTIQDIINSG